MTQTLSAVHGSFTIVRELPHPPARVFAAFAEPEAKAKWFSGPSGQWTPLERKMDGHLAACHFADAA